MKLDFLVPGFGKCGTTTLCARLGKHPEVYIPEEKETGFFAINYYRGWSWYDRFFAGARPSQKWGEGSVFYSSSMFEEQSLDRILDAFPNIRFIFVARDPIARLESYYRELHHSGWIVNVNAPYTIDETLKAFPFLTEDTLYWRRINVFRRLVPDSHIHVLFLEDLARNPEQELMKCFRFLEVDPTLRITGGSGALNSGSTKLYDSRMMRVVRRLVPERRHSKQLWPHELQNRVGRALGWRKPFRGAVNWGRATLETVVTEIADDARAFLLHYGKGPDFWSLDVDQVARDPKRKVAA